MPLNSFGHPFIFRVFAFQIQIATVELTQQRFVFHTGHQQIANALVDFARPCVTEHQTIVGAVQEDTAIEVIERLNDALKLALSRL